MKFKRILTASLAAAMLLSMGVGCKKKTSNVDYDEIMSRENVEDYVYPEQIELKIPVYNRSDELPDVTDNYWTKYVQKEFGDKHNIKMTFISIPRNEEVTVFNQLMAGKKENQPDIIFNYDYPSIVSFADMEYFQELDEEMIKKYAPTYYENTVALDEYTYLNGKKLFLAGNRPKAYNYVTLIRKDWIEKTGRNPETDCPKNTEEYLDLLRDFRDMKLGGDKTIPENKSMGNANYGNHYYRPHPYPAIEHALYSDITVASLTYEPTKLSLQQDNLKYNEGLVSPEWYLDKDGSKAKEAFIMGKAGTYGLYLTKTPNIIADLKANVPGAEVMVLPGYADERYNHGTPGRMDNPFGLMTGINTFCEHPEAVLMYYEWLSQPENLYTMQNGVEGKTYYKQEVETENGMVEIPVLIDGYEGEERLNYNANKDMWCLVIEGKDLGDDYVNAVAQAETYAPDGYEHLIMDAYENDLANKDFAYTDYMFTKPITSLSKYQGELLELWREAQTALTNCKPEEFDALYEQYCERYLATGYQEILDEKRAVFEEEQAAKAVDTSKYGECEKTAECDIDLIQDIESEYITDYKPITK